jgi:hypothetical protein
MIMKMTDEEYEEYIDELAHYLCGMSCGTAVDVMVNYCKRPDLSKHQFRRLIDELVELQNKLPQ